MTEAHEPTLQERIEFFEPDDCRDSITTDTGELTDVQLDAIHDHVEIEGEDNDD